VKVLATADLHFGLREDGDASTRRIAKLVCESDADLFVIAGDTFALDVDGLHACLDLFADFRGIKALVFGNHDLWTIGGDSFELYDSVLPEVVREHGFVALDHDPVRLDGVAVVGTVGWYDYSLREPGLRVPLGVYQTKRLRGVAQWNDGRYVRWGFSDAEFTEHVVQKLKAQLAAVSGEARKIVAVTHHLPFANMVRKSREPAWQFGNAFLGSIRLGEVLTKCAEITRHICGHSHFAGEFRNAHITSVNVGSTYTEKRLVSFEI